MLRDMDQRVTLEEVNSLIALEYGQAIIVNVRRADGDIIRKFYFTTVLIKSIILDKDRLILVYFLFCFV